mgnify:CR=1 FL=1|tara:strand:- start:86 stop:295 length:210 start_codon:yes stop_codon:yes gene_type:complete
MELKEGDLVITLPTIDKVRTVKGKVTEGLIGVVVETSAHFDTMQVYGVLIDGVVYYLFEDEMKKLEEKC